MPDLAIPPSCLLLATRWSRQVNININFEWQPITPLMNPNERVQSHKPHQRIQSGEMGAERLPASQCSLSPNAVLGKGRGASGANLTCMYRYTPHIHQALWFLTKFQNFSGINSKLPYNFSKTLSKKSEISSKFQKKFSKTSAKLLF